MTHTTRRALVSSVTFDLCLSYKAVSYYLGAACNKSRVGVLNCTQVYMYMLLYMCGTEYDVTNMCCRRGELRTQHTHTRRGLRW